MQENYGKPEEPNVYLRILDLKNARVKEAELNEVEQEIRESGKRHYTML